MEERFKLIKSAGFDGVFLSWSDEYAAVDGDKRYHPEMARRNGLFIENIHTPILRNNSLWEDNIQGEAFVKIMQDCIDDCERFHIPTAVIHVTYGNTAPSYNQIGLDRIKRLVEVAERKGINLALENLRQPGALDYLFSNIQSERLGFCYDSGHKNCYTMGTDFLSQYGTKLMALHLHDNDGTDDRHWLPGEGGIAWPVLMKKLKETGYSGPIALEVEGESPVSGNAKNPEMYLQRAFQAGKRLAEYFKTL